MRVFGRWLLYSFVGVILVVLLFSGGGDLGSGDTKGSWRSILLSMAGAFTGLAGVIVLLTRSSIGEYWPVYSLLFWMVAAGLIVGAWFSIAADLRREADGQPS